MARRSRRGRRRRAGASTCAIQPLPTGSCSSRRASPQPAPSDASRLRSVSGHACGGVASCRCTKRAHASRPKKSGRDEAHCASFTTSAPEPSAVRTHHRHHSSAVRGQRLSGSASSSGPSASSRYAPRATQKSARRSRRASATTVRGRASATTDRGGGSRATATTAALGSQCAGLSRAALWTAHAVTSGAAASGFSERSSSSGVLLFLAASGALCTARVHRLPVGSRQAFTRQALRSARSWQDHRRARAMDDRPAFGRVGSEGGGSKKKASCPAHAYKHGSRRDLWISSNSHKGKRVHLSKRSKQEAAVGPHLAWVITPGNRQT